MCVTFLHKRLVARFITSINTKRVTSQLRCDQKHTQGSHVNVSVITGLLYPTDFNYIPNGYGDRQTDRGIYMGQLFMVFA